MVELGWPVPSGRGEGRIFGAWVACHRSPAATRLVAGVGGLSESCFCFVRGARHFLINQKHFSRTLVLVPPIETRRAAIFLLPGQEQLAPESPAESTGLELIGTGDRDRSSRRAGGWTSTHVSVNSKQKQARRLLLDAWTADKSRRPSLAKPQFLLPLSVLNF